VGRRACRSCCAHPTLAGCGPGIHVLLPVYVRYHCCHTDAIDAPGRMCLAGGRWALAAVWRPLRRYLVAIKQSASATLFPCTIYATNRLTQIALLPMNPFKCLTLLIKPLFRDSAKKKPGASIEQRVSSQSTGRSNGVGDPDYRLGRDRG
jgi:hypothetical protein